MTLVASTDNKGWSPYGALWLQPLATGRKSDTLGSAKNEPKSLPSVATSYPNDGKEGVIGSSPIEGFAKSLLINSFCLPAGRRLRPSASTERPRPGATAFYVGWNRWR
jgi:hypothetical protein